MRVQVGIAPISIGFIIAIVVVLLGILGLLNVIPLTATVVFGLIVALGIARLC